MVKCDVFFAVRTECLNTILFKGSVMCFGYYAFCLSVVVDMGLSYNLEEPLNMR
jgi:hypothetical protein